MAKARTRVPVIFEVDAAGKQDDLDGNPLNVVEHIAGVTGATVTVTSAQSVLVCEDSAAPGIYTPGTPWTLQARQPRVNDLVYVTGGTLYAGMTLRADGEGGFVPVANGAFTALDTRVDTLEAP